MSSVGALQSHPQQMNVHTAQQGCCMSFAHLGSIYVKPLYAAFRHFNAVFVKLGNFQIWRPSTPS